MKYVLVLLTALSTWTARAATYNWTNTAGGSWSIAANWFPNAVPTNGDTVNITTPGIYTIIITNSSGVSVSNLNLGATSGAQTLLQGSPSQLNASHGGIITGGGVLTVTNGGVTGNFTVNPSSAINFVGPSSLFMPLYGLNLTNYGVVNWGGCDLEFSTTIITNYGTWLMTNDGVIDLGGNPSYFVNYGLFRKSGGTNISEFYSATFLNEPSGLVDCQSGTIELYTSGNCLLSGTLNTTAAGTINLSGNPWTEAGGVVTGAGVTAFIGGNLNLVTNNVPGLKFTGGNITITGTNTFQQAGAITNLTLDGTQLNGTNRIGAGALTFNSGAIVGQLTISPSGQLNFATSTAKLLYNLNIINQGTVNWTAGLLEFGATTVSNGSTWISSSDASASWGGGALPLWTNTGTFRKSTGTGTTTLVGIFTNQAGGVIEADSGTIQLPSGTTNTVGTLFLNGGTILPSGTLGFTGGTFKGSGTIGAITLAGGIITPGLSSPGAISFPTGLTLAAPATLIMDGTGTTPGSQYDQLTVTGAISLGNATLQVPSLPTVAVGTTFFIITNTGSSLISGTFNGLAENALLNASGQPFRIHYAAGPRGNAVSLVRDTSAGPTFASGISSGGQFTLSGTGPSSIVYEVQASTNFINWTNLGSATGDSGGHFTFIDTNAYQFLYRFYRTTN